MKQVKREKSTSTRGHYVTNATLLPAVIEAQKLGKVTDKLAAMLWKIAERYSTKHNFFGYSFREDMVAMATANLCNTALKFDSEKYFNPFAYYTTAIHNSFLQYLADEKKHRKIRDELLLQEGSNPSYNFGKDEDGGVRESDASHSPIPMISTDELTTDSVINGVEKVEKHYHKSRSPGLTKVLVPGVDFTQDEDGNIVFLSGDTMKVDAVKPIKPKAPRKSKKAIAEEAE